jgi:hypothetical protein
MAEGRAVPEDTGAPLLLACLCAQWCGTCQSYRETFAQVAQLLAGRWGSRLHCVWVDIEDHADALDSPDVENFPSLLLAQGQEALFWGPVLPHAAAAERLAQSCFEATMQPPTRSPRPEPSGADLVRAVWQLLRRGILQPVGAEPT